MLLVGCGRVPDGLPAVKAPAAAAPGPKVLASSALIGSAPPALEAWLAFTACRRDDVAGSLFIWDAAIQDVYVLSGALAGLVRSGKGVGGPEECAQLVQLNPRCFGKQKVLFSFRDKVFVYDVATEERIVAATDGRPLAKGGPRAVISADGKLLAYVSVRGTLVLKPTHPVYATKTRELTKIAAELESLASRMGRGGVLEDIDLSADGRWLVLNVDGAVYLYDVATPHLYELAPLDGPALAGLGDGFGHVAVSPDGRYVACSIAGQRLLVFDRVTQLVDTVPYANLGDELSDRLLILDPLFGLDGRSLYFETLVGETFKVWRYDLLNETLRALVILNHALGEAGDDVVISAPTLAP